MHRPARLMARLLQHLKQYATNLLRDLSFKPSPESWILLLLSLAFLGLLYLIVAGEVALTPRGIRWR